MGIKKTMELQFNLQPLIEFYGEDKILDEIVDYFSLDHLIKGMRRKNRLKELLSLLTPAERAALKNRKN